ncbi:MAG: hypothetical protein COW85_00895 [Ignavibacteria bacterium CG22_combo_CG10-13_8_21_14_all_37_15]|nr:MAG: hypothetical protein COW85_00895 [Ignavibacteria bacterium CG22_combo_CG10-13_8_21_14_all_37_15]
MGLKRKNKLLLLFEAMSKELLLQMKCYINLLVFWLLKKSLQPKTNKISESILFINSEKMGDLILCIDFWYSFQVNKNYKKKYILVSEEYFPLLAIFNLNYEIIVYNKKKYKHNLLYRIEVLKELVSLKFDTVVNISPERGSLNDELTILSFANKTIGLKSYSLYQSRSICNIYNKFYSHFVNSASKNIYFIMCELNKYFGGDSKEFCYLQRNYAKISFSELENYILIAPSSSDEFRNWDKFNFQKLIKRLSVNTKVVVVGTKTQERVLDFIIDGNKNVKKYIDLNYNELIDLMFKCKLFIGLDSGLSHLALQLNKTTLAIIGGGKNGIFFPYKQNSKNKFLFSQMDCFGCSWVCKYKAPYCISNIEVDEVYTRSIQLLEG